jgi:hypothetical protein
VAVGEGRDGVADEFATGLPAGRDRLAQPAVFVAPAERRIADNPGISGLLREVVGDSLAPMEACFAPSG